MTCNTLTVVTPTITVVPSDIGFGTVAGGHFTVCTQTVTNLGNLCIVALMTASANATVDVTISWKKDGVLASKAYTNISVSSGAFKLVFDSTVLYAIATYTLPTVTVSNIRSR